MARPNVKLRRKVQLRKKAEETIDPKPHAGPKKWIWFLLGVVMLCIIGYWLYSIPKNKPVNASAQNAQTAEVRQDSTDSLSDAYESEEEVALANQEEEVSEASNKDVNEDVVSTLPVDTSSTYGPASSDASSTISNDVEAEAMRVIRGDYGVGQQRKDRLGSKYKPIQSRVNELKREGVF